MASNYTNINNAIPVINNFGLKAAQLLDARSSVADQETLAALLTDGFVAEGQITYVESDQTLWIVKSVDDVLTWVEISDSDQVTTAIKDAQITLTMNPDDTTNAQELTGIKVGDSDIYIGTSSVTSGSSALITSGGVYDALKDINTTLTGLTGAMHYKGVSTTDPTGSSGPTVSGVSSYIAGDVVVYSTTVTENDVTVTTNKEYVYDGTSWRELGDEGSHLTKTEAAGTYLSSVTVNGHTANVASSNITLTSSDVGAYTTTQTDNAITNAVAALDGNITGTAGKNKTLTSLSQTDGVVSATFDTISITASQVSDFSSTVNNLISGKQDSLGLNADGFVVYDVDTDTYSVDSKTYLESGATAVAANKVVNALTISGSTAKTYDGSTAVTVTASDLNAYTKTETDSAISTVKSELNDTIDALPQYNITLNSEEATDTTEYLKEIKVTNGSTTSLYKVFTADDVVIPDVTVTNTNKTLSWGASTDVATVGTGTISVTLPANPDTTYTLARASTSSNVVNLTTTGGTAGDAGSVTFGGAAWSGTTSSVTSGASELVTSGGVYSYINTELTDIKNSLTSAMHFVGVSTTDPSTGTATVSGVSSFSAGDVVIYNATSDMDSTKTAGIEYVYDGSSWIELGDEGSHITVEYADGRYLKSSDAAATYATVTTVDSLSSAVENIQTKLGTAAEQDLATEDDLTEILGLSS